MNRRLFIQSFGAAMAAPTILPNATWANPSKNEKWPKNENPNWGNGGASERDAWIDAVIGSKSFDNPSVLSKFRDGMFYLQAPLVWKPTDTTSKLRAVTVPKGFVTDLTSIPRPFWSILPRDGSYADAAIVHDYLYWTQTGTRQEADDILKGGMQDLEVQPLVVNIIYRGVKSRFGQSAWDKNIKLRKHGESRLLLKYPEDPAVKWADWSKLPGAVLKGG